MGGALCKEQIDTRPTPQGLNRLKITITGFFLNSDTRALLLYCQIAGLDYDYTEVNMLKGEHTTEEFKLKHPSMHLPVLEDGPNGVYGTTLI